MQVVGVSLVSAAGFHQAVGYIFGPTPNLRVDAIMNQPVGNLYTIELASNCTIGRVNHDTAFPGPAKIHPEWIATP
jgi:hypothetical protein